MGVKFDLSWDNSFTNIDNNGNAVFDRAWVFVKYWNTTAQGTVGTSDYAWAHATLISGGTIGDYNSTTGMGISANSDTGQKVGAYCKPGANQVLYWNYSNDSVSATDSIQVQVMAIEMVYVPQSAFYVGSGGTETSAFYSYPNTANPYKITSEGAITVGTATGNLYYPSSSYGGDCAGPIPAGFPKGYQGFYMMKYELTQGQYRDFLNTLSREQQDTRIETSITSTTTSVTNTYVMSNTSTISYRNGLRCAATITASIPITFYCDFTGDGVTATNGEFIACNYLCWADLCAFADWAGLRPFTELEYEKAARGPMPPVPNEYAWGTSTIATSGYTMVNPGTTSEGFTTNYSTTLGNCIYSSTYYNPARVGIFAANANNTGRVTSGGSYYGIMELSGNLWERPVTVGNSNGRLFIGSHGDGNLTTTNSDWPSSSTALGTGYRGGGWGNDATYSRSSDRRSAAYTDANRSGGNGVRLARTSP